MGQGKETRLPHGLLALASDMDAICTAIDRSGSTAVEAPEGLAAIFTVVSPLASPLEAIHPESHAAAVALFERARRDGHAFGEVRTSIDPSAIHILHLFDLAPAHNCLVSVLHPSNDVALPDEGSGLGLPRHMELRLDASGVIDQVSDAASLALGWQADEMVGRPALDFIHTEDHERTITYWVDVLAETGATRRVRHRWRRLDGSHLWIETSETNRLDDPEHGCVVADLLDISDEMVAQTALRAREELLVRLTEALPTGVFQVASDGQNVFSNARWFEITELHRDAPFDDFLRLCGGKDRNRIAAAMYRSRSGGVDEELEVGIHTTADNHRVCRLRLCGLGESDGSGASVLACLDDVTESHRLHLRLRDQAQRDPLTGLLNRSAIMSRLEDCIASARRRHRSAAVLFVDLDDFKSVNDRFGHAAGDTLLCRVAGAIKECVRAEDLVGRLGGDEFVVVIPDLMVPAAAVALARRLEIELSGLIVAPGERLLSGSVGVGLLDGAIDGAEDLLAVADEAMYVVKRSRAGRYPAPVQDN